MLLEEALEPDSTSRSSLLEDDPPLSFDADPPDVDPSVVDELLVAESLDGLDSAFDDFLPRLSVLKNPTPLK